MPGPPLLFLAAALAADAQSVRFEVATAWRPDGLRITVETTWLGKDRAVELVDNGSVPGDTPFDNVWTGILTGDTVRTLPIRVRVEAAGIGRTEAGGGMETIAMGDDRISYTLAATDGRPVVRRSATAMTGPAVAMADASGVAALLGWIALSFGYVGWLVQRSGGR